MVEVSAFVERAWRDGVGPDDRDDIERLLRESTDLELHLFSAWLDLIGGLPVEVPVSLPTSAGATVRVAALVVRAQLLGDAAALQGALDELATALTQLTDDDSHVLAARAWADFALAEIAHAADDLSTMQRRIEALAVSGRPVALRITALMRMAGAVLSHVEPARARTWARRALTLAEANRRPKHAARARLLLAIAEYVGGNLPSVRKLVEPLLDQPESQQLARLLLASFEEPERAMALFGEGVRRAVEASDPASYLLCLLIGSRRYVALGRRPDALVTISAGIVELRKVAPPLARVLEDERQRWRDEWGEVDWAAAEASAIGLI